MQHTLQIRNLGRTDYEATWRAMQAFTAQRDACSADEIWLTEHDAVYTLGLNRKDAPLPKRSDIPLVHTDRGGKMTYHGPGQVVVYLLIDLKRKGWSIRQLVSAMENAIIAVLAQHNVVAYARSDAPGVYVDAAKIASLGLRLKNGCCYHGLALNVGMDLAPFSAIDPCGHAGLPVTQMRALGIDMDMADTGNALLKQLRAQLTGQPARQLNCAPASLEIPA